MPTWAAQSTRSPEIYEEWWFWTIIGGGAVVVAGLIIGIAVAAGSGSGQPTGIPLPPIGEM